MERGGWSAAEAAPPTHEVRATIITPHDDGARHLPHKKAAQGTARAVCAAAPRTGGVQHPTQVRVPVLAVWWRAGAAVPQAPTIHAAWCAYEPLRRCRSAPRFGAAVKPVMAAATASLGPPASAGVASSARGVAAARGSADACVPAKSAARSTTAPAVRVGRTRIFRSCLAAKAVLLGGVSRGWGRSVGGVVES